MFATPPKQVELTAVPKKGRKNKEIAFAHFEKSTVAVENAIGIMETILKLQDPTIVEMRKTLRNALREAKEGKKCLIKYKNIQYKPKRTRESHNTGLEKLRPISESMALFSGWEYGVIQKSRYDVTNELCAYIKKNGLQDPKNGTIIIPDAKLKELLQVEDDVILKYPTMQKYLKNCFEEVVEQPATKSKASKTADIESGDETSEKDSKTKAKGRKKKDEEEAAKTKPKPTKKETKAKKESKSKK